jgi:hypothetical protein
MRKILIWTLLFCGLLVVRAEESKPIASAGTITCDYPGGGGISKWVTSKSGFSAAIELRVKISGAGKQRHCITSWRLHVRGKDGKMRVIGVAERDDQPDDEEWIEENSFEIEAWSGDGKMLLVSQIEAQGDWDETTPIVFDFTSNTFHRVELAPLFEKLIPGDCYVVYRILRFSEDGNVLVSAMSTDNDREAGTKACFPESLWKLDFREGVIARARLHIR